MQITRAAWTLVAQHLESSACSMVVQLTSRVASRRALQHQLQKRSTSPRRMHRRKFNGCVNCLKTWDLLSSRQLVYSATIKQQWHSSVIQFTSGRQSISTSPSTKFVNFTKITRSKFCTSQRRSSLQTFSPSRCRRSHLTSSSQQSASFKLLSFNC